jgi:hypothetical protein
MYWELWDVGSKNLVEDFETEDEALRAVREILAANSPDLLDALVLVAMYDDGEPREVELPPALKGAELQARLAELAQEAVADASRAVHERIRTWLAEEGWDVRKVDDPQSSFNVMATLQSGPNVNVFQYKDHVDQITLSQHWLYDNGFRSAISQLPENNLKDIVWNIYRDVSIMGVEFYGFDTPSTEMTLRTYIYFDGLTKDALIQRILLTIRALHLAIRTFIRAFEENDQSVDEASKLLHLVSPTGGSLTVAS